MVSKRRILEKLHIPRLMPRQAPIDSNDTISTHRRYSAYDHILRNYSILGEGWNKAKAEAEAEAKEIINVKDKARKLATCFPPLILTNFR